MSQRTPERKAITLLAAVVLFSLSLWLARGAVVISGENPTFTPVETRAPHGDPDAAKTTTTTAKTTTPAAQP
jgi:hypothetical protein